MKRGENYKAIATARYSGDRQKLYEVSLSRIWQHVQNAEKKSFALVTSWRQAYSKKKNLADFSKLKSFVRGLGLGFVDVQGHWKECQNPDIAYNECPLDELVDAVEPSLFVTGLEKSQAIGIARNYEQDAIVFAGPETQGRVVLLFDDGGEEDIGEFKPQTMGQAFTQLRSSKMSAARHFQFEGVELRPQGYLESLIDQEVRKLLKDRV